MQNRKIIYSILAMLLALCLVLFLIQYSFAQDKKLKVIFLDVGQGDGILVSQGQNQLLIDGGKDGKIILEKLGKYIPFWDRTIETVIATHPDQDHIGGLISVAKNYQIGTVLETDAGSDSQTYIAWEDLIKNKNIKKIEALKNTTIKFPGEAQIEILYPASSVGANANSNDWSVTAKLIFGENSFLFTGDLPTAKEAELMDRADIKADVLKVSHHGSKYATSAEFLDAVNPEEAVISVGKNNAYGHPAPEIVERLLKRGIKIWRTDVIGDIKYSCANAEAQCIIAN
ncbi:MAG: ComEC/Rec2 family competence protein [Parcubacteria group bacterium]